MAQVKITVYVDNNQGEILTQQASFVPRVGDECLINNKQHFCRFVVTKVSWDLSASAVVLYGKSL